MTTKQDPAATLTASRHTFPGSDDATLNYKSWIPVGGYDKVVVLLHRGHEHADRWDSVIPSISMPNTAMFAWEARGHGQSPGRRGHAPTFMTYVRDLECFVTHLTQQHGISRSNIVLLAHSVGAVVAATWVHDYAPPLAGLALITPAFDVNLIIPGALTGCRMMQWFSPDATIQSYVRGHWLTRDEAAAKAYDSDKSISRDISARILTGLFDTARRVIDDAGVMQAPLLLLSAGADRVVKQGAQKRFVENYGTSRKTHLTLDEARHAIFHDLAREEAGTVFKKFAQECLASQMNVDSSENFHTRSEYEALQQPLPALSVRSISYGVQRLSMSTLGRLSAGVRLGWETGFDSGESLDYVYENKANGEVLLGKIIDRAYLDAIGWRGIRQRREMLISAMRKATQAAADAQLPSRVVDIAGGGARYLLDLLEAEPTLQALCRDRSTGALDVGKAAAQARELADRIQFQTGDAFNTESLAAITPQPGIAVVSGLYELFHDNDMLRKSLSGLHTVLPKGGLLCYTNQPWHPQVEMIARVLVNRDQQPWIMRRRPQSEMDALVTEAGFTKEAQWTDDFGIFTVALARKV